MGTLQLLVLICFLDISALVYCCVLFSGYTGVNLDGNCILLMERALTYSLVFGYTACFAVSFDGFLKLKYNSRWRLYYSSSYWYLDNSMKLPQGCSLWNIVSMSSKVCLGLLWLFPEFACFALEAGWLKSGASLFL